MSNVETLHPGETKRVANLHDKLMAVIEDYAQGNPTAAAAEIVGTIEFVKATVMGVYE